MDAYFYDCVNAFEKVKSTPTPLEINRKNDQYKNHSYANTDRCTRFANGGRDLAVNVRDFLCQTSNVKGTRTDAFQRGKPYAQIDSEKRHLLCQFRIHRTYMQTDIDLKPVNAKTIKPHRYEQRIASNKKRFNTEAHRG